MAEEPGIKGSVFAGIVDHLRVLRDAGRISAEELECRVGSKGIAVLDAKILSSRWYSIEVYGAIRELLQDVEGGGEDEYTIQAGAASARRLIEGGFYQQLDFLKRWQHYSPSDDPQVESERRSHFRKQLVLVSTIHDSLFNFGDMKIEAVPGSPHRFQLQYWDDCIMPRLCRLAVLGFWNELSGYWSRAGRRDLWTLIERDDHYLLEMSRDVANV